jgi:hypothetical protein
LGHRYRCALTGKRSANGIGFATRSAMLKRRTPIESQALSHGRHNQR